MIEIRLGKISNISLGIGGYQDCMMGLSVTLEGSGWGVNDFKGFWGTGIEVSRNTKWTEGDRAEQYAEVMYFINSLLAKSKKSNLNDLKGVPVEVSFNGNCLVSWRVLEEVI